MKQTENFFLKLFEGTDKFDYQVVNENWQKIDDAIDELLNGGNIAILPTMTIEKIENGYRVTTHDAKSSQSFEIINGKTAYQYAQDGGYIGTEEEFAAEIAIGGAVGKEINGLSKEIAVERERINKFVALEDGSTTGDAELMDIRIGADGVIYNSAGDAVRQQILGLQNNFDVSYSDNTNNVYNPADLVTGKQLKTDGSIVDYSGWNITGYMAVKPDTRYNLYYTNGTTRTSASGNYVLYDKYKNMISGAASASFTTTPETAYVRFSTIEARFNELMIGIGTDGNTPYEEYIAPTKIFKIKESVLPDDTELHESVKTLSEKMQYIEYEAVESEIITGAYARKENGSIITNQSSEMAYCMVDVVEGEKYLVTSYVGSNTAIVFYANSLYLSDLNNLGVITDYKIVIPKGCNKMAVSTRNIVTYDFSIKRKSMKYIDGSDILNKIENVEQENIIHDFETLEENDRLFALETRLGFKWKEFDTGKVVFMTDDTNPDIGVITSLLMNTYSFPMSYACITSKLKNAVDENANGYKTVKDVLLASQEFGGEILSHSVDTNDWSADSTKNGGYNGAVPFDESERRLKTSKMTLRSNGLKCNGFISPRGDDMSAYIEQVAKYYRYAYYQGADVPQIYHFLRVNIKGHTFDALKQIIDECAANKTLLVLMCHTVFDNDGEGYGYYPNGFTLENFTAIMDYLKWGNDDTKATERTDIEVTSLKSVYDQYASIG